MKFLIRFVKNRTVVIIIAFNYCFSLISSACLYGYIESIKLLLALGAHLELKNKDDFTPLLCAVWNGQTNAVKCLLS